MKTRITGLVLALLLAAGTAGLAQPLALSAILRDPVKYDHRPVTVTGTVGPVEGAGRPAAGPPSQTFLLIDGGVSIRVTGPAQPTVRTGDRVEVEGLFKLAGNQIEAFRVTWR